VDVAQIRSLRALGASWRAISHQLGIGVGTLYKAVQQRSENLSPAVGKWLITDSWVSRKNPSTNT